MAGLDIGIVLDKSLSVKKGNLQSAIRLLRDVVNNSNPSPEADHFGLITFNSIATLEFDFKDANYYQKSALLARIDAEPVELKKWTRIDLALEKANSTLFSSEGGNRPDMPNLMVVLTDGKFTNKTEEEFTAFVNMVSGEFQVSPSLRGLKTWKWQTFSFFIDLFVCLFIYLLFTLHIQG